MTPRVPPSKNSCFCSNGGNRGEAGAGQRGGGLGEPPPPPSPRPVIGLEQPVPVPVGWAGGGFRGVGFISPQHCCFFGLRPGVGGGGRGVWCVGAGPGGCGEGCVCWGGGCVGPENGVRWGTRICRLGAGAAA